MIDPLILLVISTSLALLFFMAARHKQADYARFQVQLDAYQIVPDPLVKPVARVLPWLEMTLVVLLLVPATRAVAGTLAASLLVIYAIAMSISLMRGRSEIDCGCGGSPQTLSGWLLLRNAVLAMGALSLAVPSSARALSLLDASLMVLLTAALALSYLMVEQLIRNHYVFRKQESQ
ncbi:MauE/DoxX family redox-associated membrane protein [Gilvimarinus sp. F26214L]|uniref:MauE/DoxX family redox-associated membrane protein n=1 Tax=Gilvimarinus sp. DZF01 TaxID=3461371 RepID=UPI0040452973